MFNEPVDSPEFRRKFEDTSRISQIASYPLPSVRRKWNRSSVSILSTFSLSLSLSLSLPALISIYLFINLSVSVCFLFASRQWNQPGDRCLSSFETCLRFERYPTRVKLWILDSLSLTRSTPGALLFESDKPLVGKRSFPSRCFISRLFPGYHFFRTRWFFVFVCFSPGVCAYPYRGQPPFLRDQFTPFSHCISRFVPRVFFSICTVPLCWLTPRGRTGCFHSFQNYRPSR